MGFCCRPVQLNSRLALTSTRKVISEDQDLVHFDFVIEVPLKKFSGGKVKVKVFILFGFHVKELNVVWIKYPRVHLVHIF
jgi:hypothetical protein